MILPFLLIAMQYNPEFNQIKAPQVSPQLNPGQVNLGIDRVAAEFDRQEAGLRKNMDQMRENERALQRSLQTQFDRSNQDWKNYEKLAKFSSTLATTLVENQKKVNERVMMENINQAFIDGGNPVAQAKYNEDVAELNQLDNVERGIAARYQADGGPVDVANEIRQRSGWAAYGYAVGVARQGAANYDGFREQNKDLTVGRKADGTPLTLSNASNRAEWKAANTVIRSMYMAPFLGLNQEMLNEEMVEPMRKTETMAFSTWQTELAKKQETEETLARTGKLFEAFQKSSQDGNIAPAIEAIEDMITKYTIDNNGLAGVGRKKTAEIAFALADKGMITPGQATAILNTKYQDRNGQWRKLGNFSEFAGLEQRANDAANKAWNFENAQKRREGRAIIQSIRDKGVLLNEQEAKALETRLAPLNINRYEYADLLETQDDRLTEQATELFDQAQRNNTYFPDGAMCHAISC